MKPHTIVNSMVLSMLVLLIVNDVLAQDPPVYPVTGKVIAESTGDPVFRARIRILDPATGEHVMNTAYTDVEGMYQTGIFTSLQPEAEFTAVADKYEISALYPNPIHPTVHQSVNISYTVPNDKAEIPVVEIYDVIGRRVYPNVKLASGVYFFRLRFQDGKASTAVKSLVLLDSGRLNVITNQLKSATPIASTLIKQSSNGKNSGAGSITDTHDIEVNIVVDKDGFVFSDQIVTLNASDNRHDVSLIIAESPVSDFSISGDFKAGTLTYFDGTMSEAHENSVLVAYAWDFGDGKKGGGKNVSHIYSESGTYTVELTVRGQYGETATTSQEIMINVPDPPLSLDGKLRGRVMNVEGFPLTGVNVLISGTDISAISDAAGNVQLNNLPTGVPLGIELRQAGYVKQSISLTLPETGIEGYFESSLMARFESKSLGNAELGGEVTGVNGVMVELPVEGFLRSDGSLVTGEVVVSMTPVNVLDRDQLSAFPGDFAGITPQGPAEIILSFGVAEYVIEKDGEELQLAPGKTAIIEIPMFVTTHEDGSQIAPGDTLPLWSLNESSGLWTLEGDGIVVTSSGSPTGFAMRAMVTHFTWWNIDVAPLPYRPQPRPFSPTCDVPPEEVCSDVSETGFYLCVKSIQLFCESELPDYQWPDEERPPDEEPDPDKHCEDNPELCRNLCDQVENLCTPVYLEGEQEEEVGPRTRPRNKQLPRGGAPVYLPPNQNIILTATGANGTVRGSRTVKGAAGQGGSVVIIMTPLGSVRGGNLACRQLETNTVNRQGDVHSWSFNGVAGEYAEITVSSGTASILQGNVIVRAPSGVDVYQGTFSSISQFSHILELTENGNYAILIEATANAPGTYNVGLTCIQKINYDTESGSEMVAGLDNMYAFEAKTGDKITIAALTSNFSGSLRLALYNPQSTLQTQSGNIINYGELGVYSITQDGLYAIRVISINNSSGNYTLGLNLINDPQEITIQGPVITVNNEIDNLGARHYYHFAGSQFDVRNFVLDHPVDSDFQTQIRIRGTGGQIFHDRPIIRSAFTSQNQRLAELTPDLLTQNGEYIIEILSFGGNSRSERTGEYQITMHNPQMNQITYESESPMALESRSFNIFEFDGTQGDNLILAGLTNSFNGFMSLRIYNPQGVLSGQTGNFSGYGEIGVLTLIQTGRYIVVADGNADASGTYFLGLTRPGIPQDVNLLEPLTEIVGEITIPGQRKYYRFTGSRGDVRNFVLTHSLSSLLRATMTVRQPATSPYFSRPAYKTETTIQNQRLREAVPDLLPADGEYIIEIKGSGGELRNERTGSYLIQMHIPQISDIDLNSNVQGSINKYAFIVYEFDGVAGDHINVAALLDNYSGFMRLRVFNPSGTVINNGTITTYGHTGVVILTQTGKFKIIADGLNDASGSYQLGLSLWPKESDIVEVDMDNQFVELNGTIETLGEHRFYRFNSSSDDIMNFILSHDFSSFLNAHITVRRPGTQQYFNRQVVINTLTNQNTRSRETTPAFLPDNGEYILEISPVSSAVLSQVTGSYDVRINHPDGIQIALDSETQVAMESRSFNLHEFDAVAGDFVNIAGLSQSLNGSTLIRLYGPQKTSIGLANFNTFGESGVVQVPETGRYKLVNYSSSGTTGDFLLGVARIDAPVPITLQSPSVMLNGEIDNLAAKKFYSFTGTSGDARNFILSHPGSSLLNAVLNIRQPGTQAFYNQPLVGSASTNNTVRTSNRNLTLNSNGEYIIEVSGSTGTTYLQRTGAYNVTVQVN